MPKIVKRGEQKKPANQIHINFDVGMLNALIKYVQCPSWVKRPQLDTLMKLMNKIDLSTYNYNEDLQIRIRIIKTLCEAKVCENITDPDVLDMYMKERLSDGLDVLYNVGLQENRLNKSECDTIEKAISERLQYSHLYTFKSKLMAMYEELDKPGFNSFYDSIQALKSELSKLMIDLQASSASDDMIREFNFSGYLYDIMMDKIVARAKKASTVLYTGIRNLNAMLSPGFEGGRLYLFLGGTGKGKSGVLLNIADQLRLFNPQVVPVENGIRKSVVFVTMENTVNETIERIFDMYNDTNIPLKHLDPEEVKRILKCNGKFTFSEEDGIDIDIFYYADLEIATSDLYQLFFSLRDMGKQPIALILDYILKIDSTRDCQNDERIRLTNAGKELKTFSQVFDIPVISAMQFNREGNSIIDAATRDEKDGILNFVGPALIGTAWGLINEADWVGSINLERKRSSNSVHMSFKLYKMRGKRDALGVDYFNHPFENNSLKLMTDVDKEKSMSIILSSNELEPMDEEERAMFSGSAQVRPKIINKLDGPPTVNVIDRMPMDEFRRIA